MLTRYVNTASTAGGDGTTNNTSGTTRAFATLKEAIDSLPSTLTDAYTIYCEGSAADTTAVDQTPWDFTTSATNYVLITTTGAQRHTGTYNTGIYRLEVTNANALYLNGPANHIRFDGLQIKLTVTNGSSYIGIKTSNSNVTTANADYRVTNCIVKAVQTSGTVTGYEARPVGAGGSISKNVFVNCMAIDCNYGYGGDEATRYCYNCGAYDCAYGFVADAAWTVKNCLSDTNGSTIGFVGTFSASSNYNAENDGNGAPGANSKSGTTFTFVDAANDNWHLSSSDTGAKDSGTDLSGDSVYAFSTDIDGQTRSGTWDIGPDEYQVENTNYSPSQGSATFAGLAALLNPQFAAPSADATDGNWTPSTGSDLYAVLDDTDDTDYAQSGTNPSSDSMTVKLATITDPSTDDGFILEWSAGATGATGQVVGSLRQGNSPGTEIAAWTHSGLPVGSFARFSDAVTSAQAGNITDFSDLYFRVVAS